VKFFVLFYSYIGVPGVLPDFPEKLITPHHLRVPLPVVLEVDKVAIPKFISPIGKFSGNDVGVAIDLEHPVNLGIPQYRGFSGHFFCVFDPPKPLVIPKSIPYLGQTGNYLSHYGVDFPPVSGVDLCLHFFFEATKSSF
jgi:hypothetical protein